MKSIIKIYALGIVFTIAMSLVVATVSVQAVEDTGLVEVPQEVIEISEELGEQYCICPELIQAICYVESRFRPDVENGGCIGITQVSEKWHRDRMQRLGVTDLYDFKGNITVAVDYLAELAEDGGDLEVALMKYHGESNIYERLGAGETSWYVKKVLELSAELEAAHGK